MNTKKIKDYSQPFKVGKNGGCTEDITIRLDQLDKAFGNFLHEFKTEGQNSSCLEEADAELCTNGGSTEDINNLRYNELAEALNSLFGIGELIHKTFCPTGNTDVQHCDCEISEILRLAMPLTVNERNHEKMLLNLELLLSLRKQLLSKMRCWEISPWAMSCPTSNVANIPEDPRPLDELLQYIEGCLVKCTDSKKAAKKARQKEKKILRKKIEKMQAEIIRLREEEHMRKALEKKAKKKQTEEANAASLKGAITVCNVKDMSPEKDASNIKATQVISKPCNNSSKPPARVPTRVKEPPGKIRKPKNEPVKPKPRVEEVTPKTNKELLTTPPLHVDLSKNIPESSSSKSSFNVDDIKVPLGTTITRVKSSNVKRLIFEHSINAVKKLKQDIRSSSETTVLSTKKKESLEGKGFLPEQDGSLLSRKKRHRRKNKNEKLTDGNPGKHTGLGMRPVSVSEEDDLSNHTSTLIPYQNHESSKKEQWVVVKGKKKIKKAKKSPINREEWKLIESVFAPKDIDLDDEEMDVAEREVEAFKRFCLQSIPPQRKIKVHLNMKDIVIKKKSSPYN